MALASFRSTFGEDFLFVLGMLLSVVLSIICKEDLLLMRGRRWMQALITIVHLALFFLMLRVLVKVLLMDHCEDLCVRVGMFVTGNFIGHFVGCALLFVIPQTLLGTGPGFVYCPDKYLLEPPGVLLPFLLCWLCSRLGQLLRETWRQFRRVCAYLRGYWKSTSASENAT